MKLSALLRPILAAISFLGFVSLAQAQDSESTLLSTQNGWDLEVNYYPEDGSMNCSSWKKNEAGDDLVLFIDGENTLQLLIGMGADFDGWEGKFVADLMVEVNGTSWTLNDSIFSEFENFSVVQTIFPNNPNTTKFLVDFALGSTLILQSPDQSRNLAGWSLIGSSQALKDLAACRDKLYAPDNTPAPTSSY